MFLVIVLSIQVTFASTKANGLALNPTSRMKAFNMTLDGREFMQEGYASYDDWKEQLDAALDNARSIKSEIDNISSFVSDEDASVLDATDIDSIGKIEDANNAVGTLTQIRDRANEEKTKAEEAAKSATSNSVSTSSSGVYYSGGGSGLTRQSGVNYYGGRRETYYSSNVLYHYRTNEWTVDSEGFYRTSDGCYVVASSDLPQGSTFQGSKGTCKVLDSGCAAGTTDYYTSW